MSKSLEKRLRDARAVALEASIKAGRIIRGKFGKFRSLTIKPDASLVTEADKLAEKAVIGVLRRRFGQDQIMGEESGFTGGDAGEFRWHIDPLDGTTNFVHGFPMFCVSIGLEHAELGPVLGVIHQPITGELYHAYRGGGAFVGRKPLKVSTTAKLKHALLSTGFSLTDERTAKGLEKELSAFGRIVRSSHSIRRTGSAALDITYVASGQFDGFWERGLHSWDVTAALTLLLEAGGKFTQTDGKPYQLGKGSLLASNSLLHRPLVRALADE